MKRSSLDDCQEICSIEIYLLLVFNRVKWKYNWTIWLFDYMRLTAPKKKGNRIFLKIKKISGRINKFSESGHATSSCQS